MTKSIDRGYEQTGFEMVEAGKNLELPVSDAAKYRTEDEVHPARLQNTLKAHGYAPIAPHKDEGYLSSKLLDTETNEMLHIKLNGTLFMVFPKSEEFSRETFRRVVETVDDHVTRLTLETDDE